MTILIPARLESVRLRRKALRDIGGLPMVVRTARACQAASVGDVVVATDAQEIVDVCEAHGVRTVLTGPHPSGTDRINEAATLLGLDSDETVLNMQGDYPFVDERDLAKLASHPAVRDGAIATLAVRRMNDGKQDQHKVKVVKDKLDRALYFSRSAIPHPVAVPLYWEHAGLYAMKVETLNKFCSYPQSQLENLECIEHLRALENGMEIYIVETKFEYLGVNTDIDMMLARKRVIT